MKKALYWLRPCCWCCGWFRVKCVKVFFAWVAIFISCLFSWRGSEWLTAMSQYSNTGSNTEPRLNFLKKKKRQEIQRPARKSTRVILGTFAKQMFTSVSFLFLVVTSASLEMLKSCCFFFPTSFILKRDWTWPWNVCLKPKVEGDEGRRSSCSLGWGC